MHYKEVNSIALHVQYVMKAWTVVREPKVLGSWKSPVQPYVYYDWNVRRFLDLASQTDDYFPFKQRASLNGLQETRVVKLLQYLDPREDTEALHSALRTLTAFIIETLQKRL